jgi:pimeloyl-ACP methyl ester carboxylesterase
MARGPRVTAAIAPAAGAYTPGGRIGPQTGGTRITASQDTVELAGREAGREGGPRICILHGLLGSSRNWTTVARGLEDRFHVLALDLRNHGASPHARPHSTASMARDVERALRERSFAPAHLLGHSMGGKVAMKIACRSPELVRVPVIVDVAPRAYPAGSREIAAMQQVDLGTLSQRRDADRQLEAAIPERELRQFLLTNLVHDREHGYAWRVNLPVLAAEVDDTRGPPLDPDDRFDRKIWFVVGGRSQFVTAEDRAVIRRHFPRAAIVTFEQSGHNPHMDAQQDLLQFLGRVFPTD